MIISTMFSHHIQVQTRKYTNFMRGAAFAKSARKAVTLHLTRGAERFSDEVVFIALKSQVKYLYNLSPLRVLLLKIIYPLFNFSAHADIESFPFPTILHPSEQLVSAIGRGVRSLTRAIHPRFQFHLEQLCAIRVLLYLCSSTQ